MFWRFGGYAQLSSLDSILDKPDVTVEELLDESDLIQELKQQNSKLIEYLRDENVLERLLRYVTAPQPLPSPDEEPTSDGSGKAGASREGFFGKVKGKARSASITKSDSGDGDETKEEKQRMKYAYVACEILSSEVWSISEAVLENQDSLRNFWNYIKQPAPLDPVQAGYFTKVNESLLDRKMEEMLDFFRSLDSVVPDMLQHVDCPMIMDLLLKIISLEKSEGGQGIVDWLQSQNLVPKLLSYLSPDHSSSTQTSAGDFLKAIITISANATTQDQSVIGPNELTRQLVSEPCIKTLISDMLKGGNPLTVGVGIIIEVIRKNNSDYDLENQIGPMPKNSDPIYLGTLLRQFAKHIPQFMELVHNPNQTIVNKDGSTGTRKRELKTAFGEKIEPLGFDRFKTCELMAELLHCSNMALLNERGSEAEVKRRDSERESLKAEGKLTSRQNSNAVDYSTSVDSHGFHHARAPSSESPEEIKKLEVQNNSEDDFEKVAASEAVSEDSRGNTTAKEQIGEPLERSPKEAPRDIVSEKTDAGDDEFVDEPLSPVKDQPSPSAATNTAGVKAPADAESPTSAGLSAKVGGLDLDNDTVMGSSCDEPEVKQGADSEATSLLTQQLNMGSEIEGLEPPEGLSPHPDDKPAPLFAGKSQRTNAPEASKVETTRFTEPPESEGSEVTPIDETSSTRSVLFGGPEGQYPPQYEVDIDGTPVVGDLLKMMFVENKVVPTILDFFFRFPWNNFLHNVVYDVVQQVFNGQMDRGFNRSLAIDLFETGRITERIIEGQQASDKAQAETHMRLGYMGHLTLIAEEVLKFTERHPAELLSQSVLDKVMSQAWIDYVEQTLAETRERDNAILGGVRPDMSVGPRQAVLNAVNAASSSFGNDGASSNITNALSGNSSIGLDGMELTNNDSSGGGYTFGGATLLSGFTNSSDEEDEEMDEGDGDRERHTPVSESEQPKADSSLKMPPPLQIPPSRARRQFAARLAQRKAMLEASNKEDEGDDDDDDGDGEEKTSSEAAKGKERAQAKGQERFSNIFEGIEDSSSDEESEKVTAGKCKGKGED
ncbi:SIT4 phosphatase-associated protein-domain-containing protein [Clohesyomyces aquaticus]|uniref:SIT4 phosphatase-associated protein-domain-containing protein n=1 Tax=Clohesyomyces aquaticus TaxID=1231657 RepID=A0A1Y1ZRF2_9PLEO|nr:SIT4 phosphatase-associated protein-domain-containing protein [Clohesyomyces aquaticus]